MKKVNKTATEDKKIILITGATDGFGLLVAKLMSEDENYKVVICGRNIHRVSKTMVQLGIDGYVCDVRSDIDCQNFVNFVIEKYSKIDILINNAGILFDGDIDENTYDEISILVDTNIKGVEFMTHAVVPFMKIQKSGYIINIGSQSGLYHRHKRSLYNSSKWAVTGFTKCLQVDLAKYGIRVTGFYPGQMKTSIFQKSQSINDLSKALDPQKAAEVLRYIIKLDSSILIPEIGIKSLSQTSTEEICY